MNIACIIDRKKSIQHIRYHALCAILPECSFSLYAIHNNIPKIKYDVIYFMSHSLYNARIAKLGKRVVSSVTSHEWMTANKSKILHNLKKCHGVSVNNNILYNALKNDLNIIYLPNGVDADFFKPIDNKKYDPNHITFGWVGKVDRKTKNYHSIILPLIKSKKYNINTAISRKGSGYQKSRRQMLDFYRSIDYLLVSSNTEGTPNPALEAASCGVPVITTQVGNMPDLIVNNENGFFVPKPSLKKFRAILYKMSNITEHQYSILSANIRKSILESWTWNSRKDTFMKFLTGNV